MKLFLAIATLLLSLVLAGATPDRAVIIAKEKQIWEAARRKQLDRFQELVAPDVRAVYADGIMTMSDELKAIPTRTMKAVDLIDFEVSSPDPAIAIVTYKATVQSESQGTVKSATFNCGSVWRLSHGRWQAIFHGEAETAAPPGPPSH